MKSDSPPPPPDPNIAIVHILRNGQEFGKWPITEIRDLLVCGELKPTDLYWMSGEESWEPLITQPCVAAVPVPYIGDDRPFYFIREGLLYGPRTGEEIEALVVSGWLSAGAIITFFGADQWWPIEEFIEFEGGQDSEEHGNGFNWIESGARALVGDPVARLEIGFRAASGVFEMFDNRKFLQNEKVDPLPEDGSKVPCLKCNRPILIDTAGRNEGMCMRCKPRDRK